jgi:4-hydroxy-2-oxoheptanedioate aldolase
MRAGGTTLCTRLYNPIPRYVETLATIGGFDYVEFVAEYGTYDMYDFDALCMAAEIHNLGTMIKIDQASQRYVAQRAVGAGFQAVLFTDCRSAADVRNCVSSVRPDTPEDGGVYPAADRRHTLSGEAGTEEYVQAIRDIVVCVMIEKKGAVDELDEILEIPGLDMIQWGGTDYAMHIGVAGQRTHPDVESARLRVFETAVKSKVAPRAEVGSAEQATVYRDMGVRHFSIGSDMGSLKAAWGQDTTSMRALIG